MEHILDRAWQRPFKTKSDFAKKHAVGIAAAASQGHITTVYEDRLLDDVWKITPVGLALLWQWKGIA